MLIGFYVFVFFSYWLCAADLFSYFCSGVTTAPADPAMQGARGPRGPNQDARKYFLILHCTVV